MNKARKRTILDISTWKPGDTTYIVTHVIPPQDDIDVDDVWMVDGTVHPKVAYERGVLQNKLGRQTSLPKMHAVDFDFIMCLLYSGFVVTEYKIASVERCPQTGECQYISEDDDIIPESCMFATREEAEKERLRIMDLLRRWACNEPSY